MSEQHSPEAESAIAEQITLAILGRVRRPELIVDPFAPLVAALGRMAEQLAPILRRFEAVMRATTDSGRDGTAT